MAAADRLSVLSDDVLQRVLSFAPAREAAASAVLSRRWRSLWRRTSALILDSRPYEKAERQVRGYYSTPLHAFFRDAHATLAAFRRRRGGRHRRRGGTGLKRLTLFLEQGTYYLRNINTWYNDDDDETEAEQDRRVADLLADPAVARLEELSISCSDSYESERRYAPPLDSLACSTTLRVLELTGCSLGQPSPRGLSFPQLTDLTLRDCYFLDGYLQIMVDAAPALTSLALVNVNQRAPEPPGSDKKSHSYSDYYRLPLRLVCPRITSLVVVLATYAFSEEEVEASSKNGIGIELDMPSLRIFGYRGYPIKLSLTSPAPELARVDFDVTQRHQHSWNLKYEPPSRMLASFSSTRALKLRLDCIEDIVADDDNEHYGFVLPTFPNLKLLELEGNYQYMNSNTAVATAMLLRSCPTMFELRLRLNMRWDYKHEHKYSDHVGGSFGEAMDRFESLASMSSAHRATVQIGGISELPDALTNDAFSCLQKSLRKVTLQFRAKEMNCFQVQLAKFLAENAMVLEEMHVDDGIRFWPDRLLHKVATWRADAFRRRNLPDTGGFRVYQLPDSAVDSDKDQRRLYFYGQ